MADGERLWALRLGLRQNRSGNQSRHHGRATDQQRHSCHRLVSSLLGLAIATV
jgi:hypothetical protein